MERVAAILTDRGIHPHARVVPEPEAVTTVQLADARIPPRYRGSLADHPRVSAWGAQIARAGRPDSGGAPGIATGPSLLIAGPTGTGKTHQAPLNPGGRSPHFDRRRLPRRVPPARPHHRQAPDNAVGPITADDLRHPLLSRRDGAVGSRRHVAEHQGFYQQLVL